MWGRGAGFLGEVSFNQDLEDGKEFAGEEGQDIAKGEGSRQ